MNNFAEEKSVNQAAPELLAEIRQIANVQGRELKTVIDDALRYYIKLHAMDQCQRPVVEAFAKSLLKYDGLYRDLAK
jgi:hypothetical protein